jgi:hypothetical protein
MASIPTPAEARAHLEDFCAVNASTISDAFITDERDNNIVPHVNNFCRTNVSTLQTVTEYYSGNGSTILILNRRNITTLLDIQIVRGEPFLTQISLSSVDLIPNEGILKAKKNLNEGLYFVLFPKGEDNIKVQYTYGGVLNDDVAMAIKKLMCVAILDNIEGRTGGGDLSVQNYNRSFGSMGKYSNIRKRLSNAATNILRRYTSAVVGA